MSERSPTKTRSSHVVATATRRSVRRGRGRVGPTNALEVHPSEEQQILARTGIDCEVVEVDAVVDRGGIV